MNTAGTYKRLYDIGSLPDSIIKKNSWGYLAGMIGMMKILMIISERRR